MKHNDYEKMTNSFILNEGSSPSVVSYIQSLAECLDSMRPNSVQDMRRLEMAKENLSNVRRQVKRLTEKVNILEEEMKVLQENSKK